MIRRHLLAVLDTGPGLAAAILGGTYAGIAAIAAALLAVIRLTHGA